MGFQIGRSLELLKLKRCERFRHFGFEYAFDPTFGSGNLIRRPRYCDWELSSGTMPLKASAWLVNLNLGTGQPLYSLDR